MFCHLTPKCYIGPILTCKVAQVLMTRKYYWMLQWNSHTLYWMFFIVGNRYLIRQHRREMWNTIRLAGISFLWRLGLLSSTARIQFLTRSRIFRKDVRLSRDCGWGRRSEISCICTEGMFVQLLPRSLFFTHVSLDASIWILYTNVI